MSNKVISFIIPSYNSEKCLRGCLESFLCKDQTVEEKIEVVIVNDGSADSTASIAEDYVQRYPGIFRLINQENGGHGQAINSGTKVACGKYLKVVDSDDWVKTESLPVFVKKLETCNADVVLTPYQQVNIQSGEVSDWTMNHVQFDHTYTLKQVMAQYRDFIRCLVFHSVTYRRDFYQQNRYELPRKVYYEDIEYVTMPCSRAESFYPIDLCIYEYQVGNEEQSVSAKNRLRKLEDSEKVTLDLVSFYRSCRRQSPEIREFAGRMAEQMIRSHYVTCCILDPDKKEGRRLFDRYNRKVASLKSGILSRMKKKVMIFQLMNIMHVSEKQYRRILNSRLYQLLRKC